MAVQVGTDDNYRRDVFVEMIMCCPTLPNCGSAQSVLIETHDTNLGYRGTALVGQILPNNNSINSNHLASRLNAPVSMSNVSSCFFHEELHNLKASTIKSPTIIISIIIYSAK